MPLLTYHEFCGVEAPKEIAPKCDCGSASCHGLAGRHADWCSSLQDEVHRAEPPAQTVAVSHAVPERPVDETPITMSANQYRALQADRREVVAGVLKDLQYVFRGDRAPSMELMTTHIEAFEELIKEARRATNRWFTFLHKGARDKVMEVFNARYPGRAEGPAFLQEQVDFLAKTREGIISHALIQTYGAAGR